MSSWRAGGPGKHRGGNPLNPARVLASLTLMATVAPSVLFGLAPGDDRAGTVVAVAPFSGANLPEAEAQIPLVVSSLLGNILNEECCVTVVAPTRQVGELRHRLSGVCDVDCAVTIGSRLEADKVLVY